MPQHIIVLKSHKSMAIALIFTFMFGPVGLFYSTIVGGLVMIIVPVIFVVWFLQSFSVYEIISMIINPIAIGDAFLLYTGYWIICMLWATKGVNDYNDELDNQIKLSELQSRKEDSDRDFRMQQMLMKNQQMSTTQKLPTLPSSSIEPRTPMSDWLQANPGKCVNDYFVQHRQKKY